MDMNYIHSMDYIHSYYKNDIPLLIRDYDNLKLNLQSYQIDVINDEIKKDEDQDIENEILGAYPMSDQEKLARNKMYFIYHYYDIYGLPKNGGNKKNKPKIYKNKIIQGKERNIYKIPGSRKDYIKYKGAFIAVNDYIKLKNK